MKNPMKMNLFVVFLFSVFFSNFFSFFFWLVSHQNHTNRSSLKSQLRNILSGKTKAAKYVSIRSYLSTFREREMKREHLHHLKVKDCKVDLKLNNLIISLFCCTRVFRLWFFLFVPITGTCP